MAEDRDERCKQTQSHTHSEKYMERAQAVAVDGCQGC